MAPPPPYSALAGPSNLRAAPSYAGRWTKLTPPLTPHLLSHLDDLGFTQMTPVQASTIPLFLSHKDVVVEAVTGSGKTLAFVIPVLEMLGRRGRRLKKDEVGGLIVTPTRELAEQIQRVVQTFIDAQPVEDEVEEEAQQENAESDSDSDDDVRKPTKAQKQAVRRTRISGSQLVVGGSKSTPLDDYRIFRDTGPDILVGTPGRLEELLTRKGVKKTSLETLILDEADRLLDLGFTETLHRILALLPKQRRTGLFSATMTDALSELVRMGLRNPVRVVVKVESKTKGEDRRTPASLQNMYAVCRAENKMSLLARILLSESKEGSKFIVYFASCAQVNYFHSVFGQLPLMKGMQVYALHGKQTPSKRRSMFEGFVAGGAGVLFCTDVAARGLDLPDVDVVVQYDPPTDPKVFSHRCGRTARAGRRGRAIVMLHSGREEDYVAYMGVKRIPLSPYPYLSSSLQPTTEPAPPEGDAGARQLETQVRRMSMEDREVYDMSIRAYVSYIRAYSKHETSYIFRLADLDLAAVAHAFGLIRLPAMPELKSRRVAGTLVYDEEELDFASIPFKDKTKERARLAKVQQDKLAAEEKARAQAVKNESEDDSDDSDGLKRGKRKKKPLGDGSAWSAQKERKQLREVRKEKRAAKRAFLKKAQTAQQQAEKDEEEEEEDDWNEEYRKLKKHKRQAQRHPHANPEDSFDSDTDGMEAAKDEEPFFVI